MQHTIRRLLDIYALGVAGWLLAWKLFRDRWGLLGMINAWAFWLLSTGLPIGVIRLWQRAGRFVNRKLAGGVLALGAAGSAVWAVRAGNLLPWKPRTTGTVAVHDERGTPLHLLSFNLLKHNRDVEPFLEKIRRESPDVVLFQELVPELAEGFEPALREAYPYRYLSPQPGAAGLGIVSRYPLTITGTWEKPGIGPFALRATLLLPDVPDGILDVYAVHLLAPAGDHLIDTGFTGNFRLREAQVQHLVNEIEQRGWPAIMMGDFNMSDSNTAYQLAASRLIDGWQAAGRGFWWTWPRNIRPFLRAPMLPLLRLDYCFHTEDVAAEEVRSLVEMGESDHCPLSARVRVG